MTLTTAEGWPERSPEEATLNQKARDLLGSIERTKKWLDQETKRRADKDAESHG